MVLSMGNETGFMGINHFLSACWNRILLMVISLWFTQQDPGLQVVFMKQPKKWRETIDPYTLSFNRFILSEVLGYPHAGNDVFYVEGSYDKETVRAFLKVETLKGSNIENEVRIIRQLPFPFVPRILEYSLDEPKFIITKELPGDRLSVIVGDNKNRESSPYLFDFGKTLAAFHQLQIDCGDVKDRNVFHPRPETFYEENNLMELFTFMEGHRPARVNRCFVHGDFHYANILWENWKISAVLDYELAGIGNREFDLAWACLLRPGQRFLDSLEEVELFLNGYRSEQDFSRESFNYYFVLIASWFYSFGKSEPGYQEKLKALVIAVIGKA